MWQESEFLLGPWKVRPRLNRVQRGGEVRNLQPKLMELLVCLCRHPGEVLSKERLLETVWPDTHVGEGVLTTAVSELRKILEDDSRGPSVIETVPKRGYRIIAPVETAGRPGVKARPRRLRWGPALASGGLLLSSMLGAGWWLFDAGSADGRKIREPQWVLVADFENRTGEDLLDGTLEFELEQQLAHSTIVGVAPRDRINDVLRLMRKPITSAVDEDLGREISLRDGDIRAILSGRIEKAGAGYRLGLRIVEPGEGAVVAADAIEATDQDELPNAFAKAGLWARKSLGAWMSGSSPQDRLEEVTTSSFRALHLYSQAMSLSRTEPRTESRREHIWAAVESLLRDAVREDPDFASAHLLLAWSMFNRRRPSEEVLAHAQRAVALAPTVSEWERHFIMGSYYRFLGENDKELAEYLALSAIRPTHYWAINNLAVWHFRNHRGCAQVDESACTDNVVRWARMRPQGFAPNMVAAQMLAIGQGDLEAAEPFAHRALQLLELEIERGRSSAWVDLFPFHLAWVEDNPEAALRETLRVAPRLAAVRGVQTLSYAWILGCSYLTLGRLGQARETFQWIKASTGVGSMRPVYLAMTAYVADQPEALQEHLTEYIRSPNRAEAAGEILLIRTGHWRQAERLLADLRSEGRVCEGHLKAVQGELALAKGEVEAGIDLLQEAFALLLPTGVPEYFLVTESLAKALRESGQVSSAIAVLEQASLQKKRAYWASGFLWLRIRYQLAQIHRQIGELEKARSIEAELRLLLKYADPSHPLAVALDQP